MVRIWDINSKAASIEKRSSRSPNAGSLRVGLQRTPSSVTGKDIG